MNRLHSLKIFAGLAATFTLAACSQDVLTDGTPLEEKVPLELTASNLYEAVATPQSRGTIDGTWEEGDNVAVRVNGKIKKYIATSDPDGSIHLTGKDITDADTGFWWTENGQSKKVDAWYPYSAEVPTTWEVSSTQTAESLVEEDLMYAQSKSVTQDNSMIEFEHMLTKVVINLKCESDYLENASEVKVSLTGQDRTASIIPSSFYLSGSGVYDNTIIPCELSDRATYQALVIPLPQRITGEMPRIVINVDGTEYSYTIKQDVGSIFTGGYQYTFNITVREEGLEVSVGESFDWDKDGETGSGEVGLP